MAPCPLARPLFRSAFSVFTSENIVNVLVVYNLNIVRLLAMHILQSGWKRHHGKIQQKENWDPVNKQIYISISLGLTGAPLRMPVPHILGDPESPAGFCWGTWKVTLIYMLRLIPGWWGANLKLSLAFGTLIFGLLLISNFYPTFAKQRWRYCICEVQWKLWRRYACMPKTIDKSMSYILSCHWTSSYNNTGDIGYRSFLWLS